MATKESMVTKQGFRNFAEFDQRVIGKAFKDPETTEAMFKFSRFTPDKQLILTQVLNSTIYSTSHFSKMSFSDQSEAKAKELVESKLLDTRNHYRVTQYSITALGKSYLKEAELLEKSIFKSGLTLHSELMDINTMSKAVPPPTPLVNSIVAALNFMTGQNKKIYQSEPTHQTRTGMAIARSQLSDNAKKYIFKGTGYENVYSILGPNGVGKTFDVLYLANRIFNMDVNYHSFKYGIETKSKIKGPKGGSSNLELNVFDDFHYLLDYVRKGKVQISKAVDYLSEVLSNRSKLSFIISNEPLSEYVDFGKEFVTLAKRIESPERLFYSTPISWEEYNNIADFYRQSYNAYIDSRALFLLYQSTSNLRAMVSAIYSTEGVLNIRRLAEVLGTELSDDSEKYNKFLKKLNITPNNLKKAVRYYSDTGIPEWEECYNLFGDVVINDITNDIKKELSQGNFDSLAAIKKKLRTELC